MKTAIHPLNVLILIFLALSSVLNAAKAPNFILVYMDDLGWAETSVPMIKGLGDTSSDFNQTPNVERLAREGMVLSACYSPSALCAPSRNSLLHGMTPSRLRYTVLSAVEAKKQYLGQITIPQALKKANANYVTAHFGKWHNESIKPTEAGYDVTDGPNGNGPGDFDDDRKTHLPDEDPKRIFSLTEKSVDFMKVQVKADKPFYLQLSHYAMHIWHDSLKETKERYKLLPKGRKYQKKDDLPEKEIPIAMYNHGWIINYAAMLDDVDRAFGTLLDAIEELGIKENTYVVFTSDNGGGFRGNNPSRRAKGACTRVESACRPSFAVRVSSREATARFRWCSGISCKPFTTLRVEPIPCPMTWTERACAMCLKREQGPDKAQYQGIDLPFSLAHGSG